MDSTEVVPTPRPRQLKAPRVSRACDACRKRKIRCDGVGANGERCALCETSNVPCTFVQTSTRRGPPKGYVESLERRLEAMESLLQSLSATGPQQDGTFQSIVDPKAGLTCPGGAAQLIAATNAGEMAQRGCSASASPEDSTSSQGVPALSPPAVASLDAIDRLTDELDELSVDNDRYVGRGSGLHLARSIHEFSHAGGSFPEALDEDNLPSLVEQMLHNEHRKASNAFPLPPTDLGNLLVEAYFENVNTTLAVLHRPYFERCIAGGMLQSDCSFRSLYFMVLALGSRFVDDPRLVIPTSPSHPTGASQSRGFDFFRASSASASPTLVSATLFDIQCSLLCVLWLMGAASPISAWAAVGFALRRVVDVGAHRENRARWNTSPLEDQLRKRAFHLLFGIDRVISASLGRPLAMQEEDFDLQDPVDLSDAALDEWELNGKATPPAQFSPEGPTHISGAKCVIALTRITGVVLRLLYGMKSEGQSPQKTAEVVSHLDSLLNAWLDTIPDHLRWNPIDQDPKFLSQTVALYSQYYCTQILVHREFLSPNRPRVHGFPSLAICSNAARSCANLLDVLRQRGKLDTAFFYAPLSAITAGLILLINVFSGGSNVSNLTSSAMNDVKRCINVLAALGDSTFVARKCHTGLCRLTAFATSPSRAQPTPAIAASASLKRANPDNWLDGHSPSSGQPSPEGIELDESGAPGHGYKNSRNKIERKSSLLPTSTGDLSLATFNGRPTFAFGEGATGLAGAAGVGGAQQQQQQQGMMGFPSAPSAGSSVNFGAGGAANPTFGTSAAPAGAPAFVHQSQPLNSFWNAAPPPPTSSTSSFPPPPSTTAPASAPLGDMHASLLATLGASGTTSDGQPAWSFAPPPDFLNTSGVSTADGMSGFAPAPIDAALFGPGAGVGGVGSMSSPEGWQAMLAGMPMTPPSASGQQQPSFGASAFDFGLGAAGTPGGGAGGGQTPGAGVGMELWDPSLFGDYDFSNLAAFSTTANGGFA